MVKPLTVASEFPSADGLCPDAYSLAVISPAYASPTGKLNTMLQYIYQSFCLERQGYFDAARVLESIASAEMLHLKTLGNLIAALGAQPIFCQNPPTAFNFYSTKYVSYSRNPVNMIEDDVIAERRSVALCSKMLKRLYSVPIREIVARILEDDKLHLETLQGILKEMKC